MPGLTLPLPLLFMPVSAAASEREYQRAAATPTGRTPEVQVALGVEAGRDRANV